MVLTETLDLTQRYSEIHFKDAPVPATLRGRAPTVTGDVERQLQLANLIQIHEMVGAMEKAFEITMEWMFDRYSFGRPLASYQELKHRCADMKTDRGRARYRQTRLPVTSKTTATGLASTRAPRRRTSVSTPSR